MPDPIDPTKTAPEVTPAATTEPTPAPAATPEPKPANPRLLSTILNLIKPEEKDVRPPEPEPAVVTPEVKPEAAPAPVPEKKKVTVKKPAPPAESVEDIVKRTIAASTPKPVEPAPVATPEASPIPDDLSPEERDEVELARYAEKKDPARKGLSDRVTKFFQERAKFLEARLDEEGDDYAPESDPKYKKFLQQNDPKFLPAEKRKFERDLIADQATERARKELAPEVEGYKQRLIEIEERPKIAARRGQFVEDVVAGMPKEVHQFFVENNRDIEKTREAFPLEYPIIEKTLVNAADIAEEFLSVRAGVKAFDAASPQHRFIDEFVHERGETFIRSGDAGLTRDGKTFVSPRNWRGGMEKTHWTFDNDDVLAMLKLQAQREVKSRIAAEQKRLDTIENARKARTAAPVGATPVVAPAAEEPSPSAANPPMAGASSTTPAAPRKLFSSILGIGT